MNEQETQELKKAISKLSEEEQAQIAGGNTITDKQCGELQAHLTKPTLVAYGGRVPKWDPVVEEPALAEYGGPMPKHLVTDYGGPIPKRIDSPKLDKPFGGDTDSSAT